MLPAIFAFAIALLWLGCGICWWLVNKGRMSDWLGWDATRRWPWGLVDLATLLLALVLADAFALQWMTWQEIEWKSADAMIRPQAQFIVGLARIIAMVLWFVGIGAARPSLLIKWLDQHRTHFVRDAPRGALVFLLAVPPILALQALLSQLMDYQHPALLQLRERTSWQDRLPIVFATVVVAPVVEEIMFRGALLGWLERLVTVRPGFHALLFGIPAEHEAVAARGKSMFESWGAIIVTSVLFAAMHVGNGPDNSLWGPDLIPLFLFACALGWVTRRTGRLTPAIVMHVLLNGLSITALLVAGKPT